MIFAMTSGILISWTFLIVMYRINLRKFLGYPAVLDAGCTSLLAYLMMGTLGGMVTAITGGLFLSLMITVLRKYYGYSRYCFRQLKWVTNEGMVHAIKIEKGTICVLKCFVSKFWPYLLVFFLMALSAL